MLSHILLRCTDANIDIERTDHDNDSADAIINKIIGVNDEKLRSSIHLQLKCISFRNNCRISGDDDIVYDLPIKNYNDLRLIVD